MKNIILSLVFLLCILCGSPILGAEDTEISILSGKIQELSQENPSRCITEDQRYIIFVGKAGRGKSTLVTYLAGKTLEAN